MSVKPPMLISAEDLLESEIPEARYAVPGILPVGLVLFVGKSKMGKSWLVLGLAVAIALAGVALGRITVEANDVLYLGLEDTARRLQGRLRAMLGADAYRRLAASPGRLMLARDWPRRRSGWSCTVLPNAHDR